jgi:hypothetical protein
MFPSESVPQELSNDDYVSRFCGKLNFLNDFCVPPLVTKVNFCWENILEKYLISWRYFALC